MQSISNNMANLSQNRKVIQKKIFDNWKAELNQPKSAIEEESEKASLERITQKLKAGARLTADEMDYIRKTNPELYAKAMRIQTEREAFERRAKECKSKEEVADVYAASVSGVGEKNPDRGEILSMYHNAYTEVRNSDAYKKLPNTTEEAKAKNKKDHSEDRNQEGFDARA